MGDVHIPAHDNRLIRVQLLQIGAEVVFPVHAVIQPFKLVLRVGCVNCDQIKIAVIRGDDAALMVVFIDPEAVGHCLRLVFGKQRYARVTFLLRRVPIFMVAFYLRRLLGLQLGLLQTHHVRLLGRQEIKKALAHTRAQAVYIPGNQLHFLLLYAYATISTVLPSGSSTQLS